MSGNQNQPTPLDPPAFERREKIHPKHVQILILGHMNPNVAPFDRSDLTAEES